MAHLGSWRTLALSPNGAVALRGPDRTRVAGSGHRADGTCAIDEVMIESHSRLALPQVLTTSSPGHRVSARACK